MSRCQACHEGVIWAFTQHRKRFALDRLPNPEGNQAAYKDGTGRWLTRQLKDGEEPLGYERRYMPHLVSCRS